MFYYKYVSFYCSHISLKKWDYFCQQKQNLKLKQNDSILKQNKACPFLMLQQWFVCEQVYRKSLGTKVS